MVNETLNYIMLMVITSYTMLMNMTRVTQSLWIGITDRFERQNS